MTRRLWTALALCCALGVGRVPAWAQATGGINGLVTDESGGVLPGVTILVTNTGTNQSREAVTGSDGLFTVPLLQPGPYTVKASLSGFRAVLRDGITVTVSDTARVDIRLPVGQLQETVTVSGQAPLVETTNATLGIVVNEKQVTELPLIGRNFTQLGTLIPGVVAPPTALGGQTGDATPGGFGNATGGFNVNGMRNQSNNFLLDGTSNNDTFNTGFVLRPPPDAIQEFKILTHSFGAEYGRNAGSVVNVVTKSGSNQWEGSLWEFNRDDKLQAKNFFAPVNQAKPNLKQNQFGGAGGGALIQSKLFAFGYYEGYRNTSGITTNFAVLTEAQRAGSFGSTTIRDPLTGQPFPGNQIPASRIDPTALRFINDFVPLPNSGTNRYIASPDVVDNRDQFGLRLDYQLGRNNTVLGRYIRSETTRTSPGFTRPSSQIALATLQDIMVSDTYLLSPNAINVARFAYNRIGANPAVTSGLSNADYGINVPQNVPAAAGLANMAVTGFFNGLGDQNQPFIERLNEVFQFTNDFTWIKGQHSFKFGFDMRKEHMVIAFVNRPNGDFSFSGLYTGNAAADFLLGLPNQFRRATANTNQDGSGWLFAGFAQDEFRLGPRMTVNYGVRYELPLPFVDANDALNSFRPGQQSERFPQAPVGLVYPGDPGVPRGTYATDKNNVAPRLGLAWDPTGTGRSSVRAAWGLFFDALAGQGDFFQNGVLAPPFTPVLELNGTTAAPLSLRNPLGAATGGAAGFPPGLIFIGWGEDFTTPYAHHFNVSWQQQLGSRFGSEIGYVGSRGYDLPIFIEVNPSLYTPGQTVPGPRLFPAFSLIRPTFSSARSWYDSLQASLRMQPWHGLSFLASYTLAEATDHVSGLNIGGEPRPVLPVTIGDQASVDRALELEKGAALFDVRHRFVVSFGYEIPAPAFGGTLGKHVLGGWQLNGIVQGQTGSPVPLTDALGNDLRNLTLRPDAACDANENAPRTPEQWFNTSCIVRRPLVTTGDRPGNAGRNTIRGPGFARTDLSIFKNFAIAGRQRLQLRVEAFNAFNQVRFGQPNSQAGNVNFGRITAAEDGRIVQLAVKYSF